MDDYRINNIKSQMRKGILEYCILLFLQKGKAYPSDILSALKDAQLIVVEGTIYTLLNRLKKEGLLSYEWQESKLGPPRKYFFITDKGNEELKLISDAWNEISNTVNYFKKILPSNE